MFAEEVEVRVCDHLLSVYALYLDGTLITVVRTLVNRTERMRDWLQSLWNEVGRNLVVVVEGEYARPWGSLGQIQRRKASERLVSNLLGINGDNTQFAGKAEA